MLTVIKYRGYLYYVMGASFKSTDAKYLVGLNVYNGNFETLNQTYCNFQYFVNDKGLFAVKSFFNKSLYKTEINNI